MLAQSTALCKDKAKMLHQKLALFASVKPNLQTRIEWYGIHSLIDNHVGTDFAAALLHSPF